MDPSPNSGELDARIRGMEVELERLGLDIVARSRELHDAKEHLAATTAELEQLIDMAPDALVVVNPDGSIERANRRMADMFGYDIAELQAMQVEDLMPDAVRERHREHRARFARTPYSRPMGRDLDLWAQRRDGTQIAVEISLSPIDTPAGARVIASIRDATTKREREREQQRELAERERVAAHRSNEYQRALDDYRRIVRHRIANPVHIIMGMAMTLRGRPTIDLDTRDEMLAAIEDAGRTLVREALMEPWPEDDVEADLRATPLRDGA